MKKKRYEAEGAKEYREANRRIQNAVKKAKEDWIGAQCEEIETCLNKNNRKRAYQLVKDLAFALPRMTYREQGRSSTIQDKSGKCLTEENEILSRWTENRLELYNYESCGDNAVLDCSQPQEEDLQTILHEEVEIAVASLKKGKSGVDNIPAELIQAGRETMIDVLTEICNWIWRTGEWPTPWTQSLIIFCSLFYPITLEGRRGTTDEFATIPFHLDLFSAALVELAKSIPVHSLILSSHLFFCLPLFLFPSTVP